MRPPGFGPMMPPASPRAASAAVPKPTSSVRPASSRNSSAGSASSTHSAGGTRLLQRATQGLRTQAPPPPPRSKEADPAWVPGPWRPSVQPVLQLVGTPPSRQHKAPGDTEAIEAARNRQLQGAITNWGPSVPRKQPAQPEDGPGRHSL